MQQRQGSYRSDIDGLRCVAVLSVVAYHFGLSCPGGFTGVDIFFVISGYLIGSQIYSETREGRFSYASFYFRRARRIVPALLAVLVATSAVMLALASPGELREFARDAVAAVFSVSNITLYHAIDYFRPAAESHPLLMTWSLGVEEQFYIFAPVVLGLVVRLKPSRHFAAVALLAALSLLLAVWKVRHAPQAAFYLLPPRAWELAVGVLVAIWRVQHAGQAAPRPRWHTEAMAAAGLLLILVPVAVYDTATPFPGLAALPSVLGAALLLHVEGSVIQTRVLSHRVATFFGLVSYSLYLWHWPLISVARMTLEEDPSLALRLTLLAASVALAYASWRWVETPFRRTATAQRQALQRYAAVLAVAGLVAGAGYVTGGLPGRWPAEFVAREAQSQPPQNRCLVGYGGTALPPAELCGGGGSVGSAPGVALVGDSHASALAPAIKAMSQSAGWQFRQWTKSSCPFLTDVTRPMARYPMHAQECLRFNRDVMQALLASPSVKVVVVGGFWGIGMAGDGAYTEAVPAGASPAMALEHGLLGTVQALRAAGKQVVLMGDVPFFNFPPLKRVATCNNVLRAQINRLDIRGSVCEAGRWTDIADDAAAHDVVGAVARRTGATYLDPRAHLCDPQGCSFSQGGQLLYLDRQHLSVPGALRAAESLKGVLGPGSAVLTAGR